MPNQYTSLPPAKTPASCARCGATTRRWQSQRKAGRLYYCSRDCHAESKLQSALAALREPIATRLPNGCLIFNGSKNARGYGRVKVRGVKRPAHVVAWEVANGRPFPDGLKGCHNCPGGDNPSCVEPAHIWPGTNADNSADAAAKGRTPRGVLVVTAKLTDEAVRDIRARYRPRSRSASQQRLADEYGVSQSIISLVVLGKYWKHVTP